MPKLAIEAQNKDMEYDTITKEIKITIKDLLKEKSLGLDMVLSKVFQQCWFDIWADVVELIQEVLLIKRLFSKLNISNIILIPKLSDLHLITNYFSIFLLNQIY